jgi:hypothetical protein
LSEDSEDVHTGSQAMGTLCVLQAAEQDEPAEVDRSMATTVLSFASPGGLRSQATSTVVAHAGKVDRCRHVAHLRGRSFVRMHGHRLSPGDSKGLRLSRGRV